ncbi:lysoplasmalogenase [Sungkyunkwania multivorans]|uniref:Lysoplasmalogenase n=1 Tax=Sungkyunkwania multivorans TaxID=1173618 RepID=A0ABW3CUX2_9FLAO
MKNLKLFLFLFLINLALDIVFNNIDGLYTFRFITKPGVTISLLLFYYQNRQRLSVEEYVFVLEALAVILIGNTFLLEQSNIYFFGIGIITFMVANVLYTIVFFRDCTFRLKRLLPVLVGIGAYAAVIFSLIKDNLGPFLIPAIFFLISGVVMLTMSFLRKGQVNNRSFWMVFIGSIFAVIGWTIVALNQFHKPFPGKNIWIMFFHGLAHLNIALGILYKYHKMEKITK